MYAISEIQIKFRFVALTKQHELFNNKQINSTIENEIKNRLNELYNK